ncbi:hypothetical protein [Bacteroides stercoris]|jgi:hypothetical protein|uniref:hypothetical protein n=1 Tax=Bacteroides stercoris TaxID=46506 RepID=UPI0015B02628|nr:MAG TPA: hypothetical protein [Caudoviricetes sp.]
MARKALTEEEKLKVINENLADFSKDKSQEKIDSFNAKDVDKRYTAILGFIRKNNDTPTKTKKIKGGKLGATIVQQLKFANQQIESNGDLTDKELEDIMDNLNAVSATIASYKEKVKAAKKAKLEAEIRRMQSELEKLD